MSDAAESFSYIAVEVGGWELQSGMARHTSQR